MVQYDNTKLRGLFSRSMDEKKITMEDKTEIETYMHKVFNKDIMPSTEQLHQFNQLVVEQADEIAKPMVADILGLIADVRNDGNAKAHQYKIPKKHKAQVVWSANGTSVDYTRIAGSETRTIVPATFQAGVYYETTSLVDGDVEDFRNLVNKVAEAKVKLYLDKVFALLDAGLASGKIPAVNQSLTTNITLAQYNKIVNAIARYGGRPVLVADIALVDKIGMQQASDSVYKNLLTEDLKGELANDLTITRIGRSTAISYSNPFTDESNTAVELPINKGFVFAGAVGEKPFKIFEFGALKQFTYFDHNLERVELKLVQEAGIDFVFGEAIGYIKDDSVTL